MATENNNVSVDAKTQSVIGEFTNGALDRRAALRRLMTLGLSAPAAYIALGLMTPSEVQAQFSSSQQATIAREAQELAKLASHPEVVQAIKKIETTGEKTKQAADAIKVIMNPQVLKDAGVSFDKTRASIRIFERDPKSENQFTILRGYAYKKTLYVTEDRQPPSDEEINRRIKEGGRETVPAKEIGKDIVVCTSVGVIACVTVGT